MTVVCVFCENVFEDSPVVCPVCNEYKGLMLLTIAVKEYDFLEYLKE
jgi:hypothetical protein